MSARAGALCCVLACGSALAQPSAQRTAGRIVRQFDFEELDTNPGEVPQDWYRNQDDAQNGIARPDFPAWNHAGLLYSKDAGVVARGGGCVYLPTLGGNTSLLLGPRVIPVMPEADYLVRAQVRTQGLDRAGAAILVRMLDDAGAPIKGTERLSTLATSRGAWSPIEVAIASDAPGAASLQIELVILQPRSIDALSGARVDPHRVYEEDRDGGAAFDDVTVVQMPRISLATTAPGNIISAPEKASLRAQVRDMVGNDLRATLELLDERGVIVDAKTSPIKEERSRIDWEPRVPAFGWYRARMRLRDAGGVDAGSTSCDFVWLAPGPEHSLAIASPDRLRTGLSLPSTQDWEQADVRTIAQAVGAGSIRFPVWSTDLTPANAEARATSAQAFASALLADGRTPVAVLGPVPETILALGGFDSGDAWPVLLSKREGWLPVCEDIFDRLGPRIGTWQIGMPSDQRAFWRPWRREGAAIEAVLARNIPGSVLAIPTSLASGWDAAGARSLASPVQFVVSVPPSQSAAGVRTGVETWAGLLTPGSSRTGIAFSLQPPDALAFGPRGSAAQLARQMVECWRALGSATDGEQPEVSCTLHAPWTKAPGARNGAAPSPALAAWSAMCRTLEDRRIVGEFPVAEGVRCLILAPLESATTRRGAMILWNESAPPDRSVFEGAIGRGPLATVDIYGNQRTLTPTKTATGALVVRVPLSSEPVCIEGVDIPLVRFLSGVSIEPAFLEAGSDMVERTIVLENPWSIDIAGKVTIVEPGGFGKSAKDRSWRITPRSSAFAIAPGKSQRVPFNVAFSASEEAGPKAFVLSLDVTADESYGTVETTRYVGVGLKDFTLDVRSIVDGEDVVIEATVTNTSTRTLTLEATAIAPGSPRAKGVLAGLAPGRQMSRRFLFGGRRDALRGQSAIVSLNEPESGLRLNKSALVP